MRPHRRPLTREERDKILMMFAQKKTCRQVAEAIGCSVRTAENYGRLHRDLVKRGVKIAEPPKEIMQPPSKPEFVASSFIAPPSKARLMGGR